MNDVNFLFMRSSTSFSIASSLNHVLSSVIYMYILVHWNSCTVAMCNARSRIPLPLTSVAPHAPGRLAHRSSSTGRVAHIDKYCARPYLLTSSTSCSNILSQRLPETTIPAASQTHLSASSAFPCCYGSNRESFRRDLSIGRDFP